jgi:2-desacetyl-2-hydroxyethyl bacteriochlorophyllide A dehydrogenase
VCPGHEISGVVEALGRDVRGWSEGDRVTIEPIVRCGACDYCRRGDYHLCSRIQFHGVTLPGGMATSVVVPAYTLFKLPAAVDFELGALTEPTAVTVHALRLGGVKKGSRVLVLGAGTIGQLAAASARHLGADSVAITARHAHQREAARRLGCDQVLDPERAAELDPRPHVVIETVGGTAETLGDGIDAVARGGSVIVVGLFDHAPRFDALKTLLKEVHVVGSMVYNRPGKTADFDTALEILADRGEDLRHLVTHVFPLANAQRAFETAADKTTGAVKVMLQPS